MEAAERAVALVRWVGFVSTEAVRNAIGGPAEQPRLEARPSPGTVAVVTGSTGVIGQAVCEALAEQGYHVVAAARDRQRGEEQVRRLRFEGSNATFRYLDLRSCGSVRAFAAAVAAGDQPVDLLVNNAGTASPPEIFAVNFTHTALLTELLRPRLAAGRIINVSSSAHIKATEKDLFRGDGQLPSRAYAASKLALLLNSHQLRREGLDVHDVHPGLVWTPVMESTLPVFLRTLLGRLSGAYCLRPRQAAALIVSRASARCLGPDAHFWTPHGCAPAPALVRRANLARAVREHYRVAAPQHDRRRVGE